MLLRSGVYPDEGGNPILGRFHSPDPYQQFHSPYLANFNNPANFVDPSGGWGECFWEAAEAFFKNTKGAVGTDGFATGLAIVQTGMVAINAVMNIGGMHKDLAKSVDELAGEMAMATTGNALQSQRAQSLSNNSIAEPPSDPEYEYKNDGTRGIQIFYTDKSGNSASVSLKNMSKDEMDGAIKASGENDFVKDVISALRYLKEADNRNKKILSKLATGKKVTAIRKAKMDYDHYRAKDVISKEYPENNELKGVY